MSPLERERELLDSLKQSEITNVVTKGLNPNAPMKDSGIPWIGLIPEHWEVKKMRSIFQLAHEKTVAERTDLLSLSQYTGIRYKVDCEKTGMFEAESTIGYNVVHKGQFVMNIMLAWNGSYAVSDLDGIISPSYCIFDFKEKCDKRYFNYLLRTSMYQGIFKANSKGLIDSRLRLYPDYFFPIAVLVPPVNEQEAISNYIDEKLAKIDSCLADLQAEIDYLKEFKQRLVSDAVTGQICVAEPQKGESHEQRATS
jgi:type I restriction enzyme, S subunit